MPIFLISGWVVLSNECCTTRLVLIGASRRILGLFLSVVAKYFFTISSIWESVGDIRQLGEELGIHFSWVRRKANQLAHVVASKAVGGPPSWEASPPSFILLLEIFLVSPYGHSFDYQKKGSVVSRD